MVSFSKLPNEIKEVIFSKICIRDLYEVSVVSEEWWWLTVKTYKRILSEEDQLIRSLMVVYNRVKKLSTPLMWFHLVKYGNFNGVKLNYIPRPMVLDNFLESRNPIRSLYLGTKYELLADQESLAIDFIETKLDDVLKYFPKLEILKLHTSDVDPSILNIPKGIKQVHLSGFEVYGVAWSSLFEDPDSIQSLELQVGEMTYDRCVFKNLKSLSLEFDIPLDERQMKNILDLIRGHKLLKSVKLVGAFITKEWFNLFGTNIENIILQDIDIEPQLLTDFGNNGCYERQVLSFVCCDIQTVKRFALVITSMDFVKSIGLGNEDIDIDYRALYSCKPQLMEEKLFLDLDSSLSRQLQTITTADTGPALRDLRIRYETCTDVKPEYLTKCVPSSVKNLKLELEGELENLSITQLCEQPQNLEDLNLYLTGVTTSLGIQRDCFTTCTQLKVLEITHVNREGLQNLLQQLVTLEKLTLIWPERGCLTDLRPTIVGKTIREVNLNWSDARLEDVLDHCPNLEVLRLSFHRSCPISMPTAIAKLKLFSAMFLEITDIRDNNTNIAFVMDSVDVPCKLFYSDLDMRLFTWKLGWTDSIVEEFKATKGYVYCCGIPTRYLEARGIQILGDVKQFSEKCNRCR